MSDAHVSPTDAERRLLGADDLPQLDAVPAPPRDSRERARTLLQRLGLACLIGGAVLWIVVQLVVTAAVNTAVNTGQGLEAATAVGAGAAPWSLLGAVAFGVGVFFTGLWLLAVALAPRD